MSGRVRAAGRGLTVGELREALADLDDRDPVTVGWSGFGDLAALDVWAANGADLDLGPAPETGRGRVCSTCGCDGTCGYDDGREFQRHCDEDAS